VEVHFPPELELKLTTSAAKEGRNPGELLQDVVTQYFEEKERFIEADRRTQIGSILELPVWRLGALGALHRRDIYDDAH
jgi:hypothetical protein